MLDLLGPGDFVRLAWRLGREGATGRLDLVIPGGQADWRRRAEPVEPPTARLRAGETHVDHQLYLRRGYVTSARVAGAELPIGRLLVDAGAATAPDVERALAAAGARLAGHVLRAHGLVDDAALDAALRRQSEARLERLAAVTHARYRFTAGAPPPPSHRSGRPLALAAWTRRHVEARVDAARARAFADEVGARRLTLRKDLAPDPAECDDSDRRVLAALAAPRRLDEIARAAGAPRTRLLAFLCFLARVGALDTGRQPADVLGVPAGASPDAVKQAYRRLARALHPDLNPDGDPRKLREVIAAYQAYRDEHPSG
jgi:hypothetical protein